MTPEGWRSKPLRELVAEGSNITYGVVQPGPEDPMGVLFIRSGDVAAGHLRPESLRTISPEVSAQYRRTQLIGGELLIALVGQPGAVMIAPSRLAGANIARQVGLVRLSDCVETSFAKYYLMSDSGKTALLHETLGSVQQVINLRDLEKVNIPLPPLSEQRKIAAILSSIDDAIEATQSVIDQLQVVKKAMMAELLTRGLPGRHSRFKQTEIGEVPEGWEVVCLGEVTAESAFGPRFPATNYSQSGRFGTLRTTDISDDWEINYRTIPRADLDYSQFRHHLLQDGDLLVTRSGTCGVVCVFRTQELEIIPGAFLIRFRLRPTVDPEFVRLAMMTPAVQTRIQAMAAGGVQKNLSSTNLAQLQLPLPGIGEQRQIVLSCSMIDARLNGERAVLAQIKHTKSALSSALLTGEVRVKPDEATP